MSKLIIFDLDGVLIDSKEIHFDCLNKALASIDLSENTDGIILVVVLEPLNFMQ